MPAWLTQISQFAVFLGISAIGFVFLIVSLIFGEIADHLDASFDRTRDQEGPGFLSTRVLSVFVTAFGGFGAVGTYYGLGTLAASGVGFLSGVFFAGLIYAFATFLYSQQASSARADEGDRRANGAGDRVDPGGRRRPGALPDRRRSRRQDCPVARRVRDLREHLRDHRRGARRHGGRHAAGRIAAGRVQTPPTVRPNIPRCAGSAWWGPKEASCARRVGAAAVRDPRRRPRADHRRAGCSAATTSRSRPTPWPSSAVASGSSPTGASSATA